MVGGINLRVNIWLIELFDKWEDSLYISGRYRIDSNKWLGAF